MNAGTCDAEYRSGKRAVKRRMRTKLERRRVVEEILVAGTSVAAVARAHGVNTNQVYHWRKLYERGLLDTDTSAAKLVPVSITDDADRETTADGRQAAETSAVVCSCSDARPGTIHLVIKEARVSVQGRADEASLRILLEHLLR
jgi:transposase-like protein